MNQEKASFFFHIAWINTKNQILCLKIEKKKEENQHKQMHLIEWSKNLKIGGGNENDEKDKIN